MASADHEAERKRLSGYYASLTEGELQHLAEQVSSLTDLARELLEAEILRRGLVADPRDIPDAGETTPSLVKVRNFRDLPEALLAQRLRPPWNYCSRRRLTNLT